MSYFNSKNYLDSLHWHVTFYEDNYDIEGIALKRIDGTWDIFYDDSNNIGLFSSEHLRVDFFGAFLFNETEDNVEQKFHEWVRKKLIPYLKVSQ